MKTMYRKGRRLVVEEFTEEELKEYLQCFIQQTNRKDILVKIASAVHGKDMCEFREGEFRIYTNYMGAENKMPYEND